MAPYLGQILGGSSPLRINVDVLRDIRRPCGIGRRSIATGCVGGAEMLTTEAPCQQWHNQRMPISLSSTAKLAGAIGEQHKSGPPLAPSVLLGHYLSSHH